MHTERVHMQRGCIYTWAVSPRGWVLQRCCSLPCLPDGVVSSKEGMGRAPTLWDVLHTLHPVVSTPSRLLSLLRYAAHPLRIPSMRYREVLQGIYTLCYSLYGLHAALYTLHHVVYHWYSTKGIAT